MQRGVLAVLLGSTIAVACLVGAWYGQRGRVTSAAAGTPEVLLHSGPAHALARDGAASIHPGTLSISPGQQQLIGVRVRPVERAAGTHVVRLLGRVAPDETRLYRLNAGIQGVIRELSPVTTGSRVRKDQWLATYVAPDAIPAIQAYVVARNTMDRLAQGGGRAAAQSLFTSSNFEQRLEKLQDLGLSDRQIAEIERTREVPRGLEVLAPVDGFVLARAVSPGFKFDRGAEWYRVADLSRVWILTDVFLSDAPHVRPGLRAQVSVPEQRHTVAATVAEVLPQFDATTRTLKVRIEADNPGHVLRPDMFVDVELSVSHPPAIAVPVDAVIDSGVDKTVFVDRGGGRFEPRPVQTGWRHGDRVEIVAGLAPGERVVTAGTFLLDSETRLRPLETRAAVSTPAAHAPHHGAHAGHAP